MNLYRWHIVFYESLKRINNPNNTQSVAVWADGEDQAKFMFDRLYNDGRDYFIDTIFPTHVVKSEKLT